MPRLHCAAPSIFPPVTSPDIGYVDPGTPMDFHAHCEVYLGQDWLTFDPRYNVRALAA